MISYGKQFIDEEDITSVVSTLRSDFLTQGPTIFDFENSLSSFTGAKYSTVVSNGTAALHLIGIALGWKQGDIILSTPITFLSSVNAIVYCGATPDFVDINPNTYTIDVAKLRNKIETLRNHNKFVKAVIAVDYGGHPCDWKVLKSLSKEFDFQLVADSCHSLGSTIDGSQVCSSKFADAVSLSFHPVKLITTGEGGAILTNSEEIHSKVQLLRTHGMSKNPDFIEFIDGPWYYEMIDLGYNYRMTDFQAALGISQMKKLSFFIERRKEIAAKYSAAFKDLNGQILGVEAKSTNALLQLPIELKGNSSAFHLYPILINFNEIGVSKLDFFNGMLSNGIRLQVHYIPVHLQPYYRNNFGFFKGEYLIAEEFYKLEFSLPIYPALGSEEQSKVISSIYQLLGV